MLFVCHRFALGRKSSIIQRLLHVLPGDFVGIADGFGGRGGDAAELIVINQLLDRRMIAADRAEWFQGSANAVAPEIHSS